MRAGLSVHDPSLCLQMVAAVRTRDEARQRDLRHRYLDMLLDSMRARSVHR